MSDLAVVTLVAMSSWAIWAVVDTLADFLTARGRHRVRRRGEHGTASGSKFFDNETDR